MNTVVSALTARRTLGELLNRAFYHGEETFVERKGKIIAKIVPASSKTLVDERNLLKYAGIWRSKKDVSLIRKTVKEGRVSSDRVITSL